MEEITFTTTNGTTVKTSDFGYRLTGFDQGAIEPRTSTVEIPGKDGVLDMSEALTGDVVYDNYTTTISGLNIDRKTTLAEREQSYTELKNALQGRYVDFVPSFDAEYTRKGRITSIECEDRLTYSDVTIKIDTEPYKSKGVQTEAYNVANGITAYLVSGRKAVRPTFELTESTVILYDDSRYVLPAGAYQLADVIFTQGTNKVFMLAAAQQSYVTHKEMSAYSYAYIGSAKPIYEWYRGQAKYSVDEIEMEGTDPFITGTLTFTATDSVGNQATATLDLGESFIGSMTFELEDGTTQTFTDRLVIEGNSAWLYKQVVLTNVVDEETGEFTDETTYTYAITPMIEVHYVSGELYSLASEIVSVANAEGRAFSYRAGEHNTAIDYDEALHSDYASGGDVAMTNLAMGAHRQGDLRYINRGTVEVMSADNRVMAYIQYDWYDL